MATLDKGTPIGVTELSSVLDKGTPIGMQDANSENAELTNEESDEVAKDSE
jgi:hypothetical protein